MNSGIVSANIRLNGLLSWFIPVCPSVGNACGHVLFDFPGETGVPIRWNVLSLFYIWVRKLYATWNCHKYFGNKIVAVQKQAFVAYDYGHVLFAFHEKSRSTFKMKLLGSVGEELIAPPSCNIKLFCACSLHSRIFQTFSAIHIFIFILVWPSLIYGERHTPQT